MSKVMLVNVTHVEESRVAVLDDGILAEYEIETMNRTALKGNIYNAVVESVHASLEAAFVRLGPDLKGFLPLDEINFKLLPSRGERGKQGRIGQHLHQGQKLMAQVVREPFAGKPPTVSTFFSLPGRFLVLMPGADSSGISRKIEDSTQRDRLKKVLDELRPPEGFGLIVRTAGMGQTKAELQRDLRYLLRLWESIQRASKGAEFPGLVYREADLVIRTIRDHFTPDIGEVWIDSQETYDRALAFVKDVMPTRARILKLYTGDRPLFNRFNLEEQIERIYKRRVPLPSGGEIVIDGTEALTAIDVNSARSKRSGDVEENILQTNLEAAAEIARQLRLRDLGGLVVVDFIDMGSMRNKKKVEKAMRDALRGDKAKYDVTVISKLGLMELARQRIKGAKMAASYATCPACDGHGLIKNVETSALAALRKLQTHTTRGNHGKIRVDLPAEVATWLLNHKRDEIVHSERRHDIQIEIQPDEKLLRHDVRFTTFPREKTDEPPARDDADAARTARRDGGSAPPAEPPAAPEKPARKQEPRPKAKPKAQPQAVKADDGAEKKTGEESASAATAETAEAKETSNGRSSRRRRRRRRRPRSSSSSSSASSSSSSSSSSSAQAEASPGSEKPSGSETPRPESGGRPEEVVPTTVRADELMPAASGGYDPSSGKAKNAKSKGSPRRKRKSGGRSSRSRRSPAKS